MTGPSGTLLRPTRRRPRADAAQAQLLDQAVLEGQVGAFDTSLGLARVRAPAVDVELVEHPSKLRIARTVIVLLAVDAEHAGLVAVERLRLAMAFQVSPGRLEIAEG